MNLSNEAKALAAQFNIEESTIVDAMKSVAARVQVAKECGMEITPELIQQLFVDYCENMVRFHEEYAANTNGTRDRFNAEVKKQLGL